ncbi:MAG: ABC transporter substrate-binding protein [Proteobacteria bacterium]|nr:MAG: ABC transporter substrate-binding protein [Pseudomonadota bacterium]
MNRRDVLKGAALGAVASAGAVAAPAIAKGRLEVNMVSTWPRDFPGLGTAAQRFAERINTMSDGRIKVNYFAAGERVKAFDVFDEVAGGNAQIYHGAEYYFKGKHPGFSFFTSVPFGLTYSEMNAWIRFGGGQELWDKLTGKFGLKALMCGNTGVQMGGWFRKEIKSASDFKGLKIRIPGLGGDVMAKLGASPVSLPGGQIYENLMSGAIDATEWVGPWNDELMKFYEAAKFYYYPGMHEPGSMLSLSMNKKWWESLSRADQMMIEAAASMENDMMVAEYNANNGAALKSLVKNHGVKLRQFSEDTYDSFGEATEEVLADVIKHDSLTKEIYESFVKARADLGAWTQVSDQAYVQERNRVLGL